MLDRPVISNILLEEPILEGRLAAKGSGLGLAPTIPVGMRAVSVRVNDVAGVAGFVLPGMHVDVLVTGRPPTENGDMTTTCLQNILVLSAGQTMQPDARGQAMPAPTVTLLVTPDQAETLTLAGSDGRIQLVLRNSSDQTIEKTPGRVVTELYNGHRPAPEPPKAEAAQKPRPRPVVSRRTSGAASVVPWPRLRRLPARPDGGHPGYAADRGNRSEQRKEQIKAGYDMTESSLVHLMGAVVLGASLASATERGRPSPHRGKERRDRLSVGCAADLHQQSRNSRRQPGHAREILLHGKGVGSATLIVWSKTGQRTFYNVSVELESGSAEASAEGRLSEREYPAAQLARFDLARRPRIGQGSQRPCHDHRRGLRQNDRQQSRCRPAGRVEKQILLRVRFAGDSTAPGSYSTA